MPTYEYLCTECNTNHDIVQSMADPTLTTCPACGKESLRKQFTGVGVMFKGSGFYRTDSRAAESSGSTTSPKSDSGSSTSTSPSPSTPTTSSPSAPAKPAAEKSTPKKSESSSGSAAKS